MEPVQFLYHLGKFKTETNFISTGFAFMILVVILFEAMQFITRELRRSPEEQFLVSFFFGFCNHFPFIFPC